ncbi:MAG: adenine phosphoribosyltransferase [Acidimicrobiales bacterium]
MHAPPEQVEGDYRSFIRDVADFPHAGVAFKDITPLLADAQAFSRLVKDMAQPFRESAVDVVVGIEARGFILAAPVALALGAGFVPVRKAGKLPWAVYEETYELEYGAGSLEVHEDAISAGQRVLVVDDVLATGGTAAAAARLVTKMGGVTAGFSFALELSFLEGRRRIADHSTFSLVTYR